MPATNPLHPEIDFARDKVPDLHELLENLRSEGPVVSVNFGGAPVWLILDYAELQLAFLDQQHFDMGDGYLDLVEKPLGRNIMTMSGAEHRINRAIVASAFQPSAVRAHADSLNAPGAREIQERIARMPEVDLVTSVTRPFPFTVIVRMLGIPVADEGLFLDWAAKLFEFAQDPEGAMEAKAAFDAYVLPILRERRAKPGEDMISSLVQAEFEGQQLSDEQVLTFLRLLFPAGSDTTYKVGGSMLAATLADPVVRAHALKSQAARDEVVSEALRWQPPTALLPRKASGDTTLGGKSIKKGDWLLFGVAPANSDPKAFAQPRRFDPTRNNRDLISFGRGPHFCLGIHLARRELEVALRVVLECFPEMALMPERPVEFVGGVLRGPRSLWVRPHGLA